MKLTKNHLIFQKVVSPSCQKVMLRIFKPSYYLKSNKIRDRQMKESLE